MALRDFFKKERKKKKEKVVEKEALAKSPADIQAGKPVESPAAIQAGKKIPKPRKRKKASEWAYKVLKGPHITEKATDLAEKNQYVFRVFPRANKIEVKKAVEEVYGVDVVSVRIINIPRKPKRLGRTSGWKKGYKKAIVKIKQGQKIEIMPR